MAVVMKMDMPGGTAEFYDAVCRKIGFPEQVPEGLISHVAYPTDIGWCVCDIWQSEDMISAFDEGQLGTAIFEAAEEFGIDASAADRRIYKAHAALARELSPIHA